MASTLLHLSILAFFPALMALAASMDLLTYTIPNRICASLALGYLAFATLLGVPAADMLLNVSCACVILAIVFVMFNLGWVGGGDAKLAAATALCWAGTPFSTTGSPRRSPGASSRSSFSAPAWRRCLPLLADSLGLHACTARNRACPTESPWRRPDWCNIRGPTFGRRSALRDILLRPEAIAKRLQAQARLSRRRDRPIHFGPSALRRTNARRAGPREVRS
jgi:hypothetical protein